MRKTVPEPDENSYAASSLR